MKKEEVFDLIVQRLMDIVPNLEKEEVEYDSFLCLLGGGSVERAELIETMMEDLGLVAHRFEFHTAGNLGELADMLLEKMTLP